jgi:adenine/guanine phosphoribosyltransferase-like PRPP-binding protein
MHRCPRCRFAAPGPPPIRHRCPALPPPGTSTWDGQSDRPDPPPAPRPELRALRTADPADYLDLADLARDTLALAGHLPTDLDAIAGIARSGMIPAGILAAYTHLPLLCAAPDGACAGACPAGHGFRLAAADRPYRRIALIDDSAYNGHTLPRAAAAIAARHPGAAIFRAAIYARPQAAAALDLAAVELAGGHFFAWNLWNSGHTPALAADLDGVLCCESTGRPLQYPRRRPLAAIVTGRPERHRAETQAWLDAWGLRTRTLVMGDWRTIPNEEGAIGQFKAHWYSQAPTGVKLFAESSPLQARVIAALTRRPVLCPALQTILNPAP